MYHHPIRLHRAWKLHGEILDGQPIAVGLRQFNCPTGLVPGEEVWLVLEEVRLPLRVQLNDQPLGPSLVPAAQYEFAVTELLRPSNQLRLERAWPQPAEQNSGAERADVPAQWLGAIRLEIRLGEYH